MPTLLTVEILHTIFIQKERTADYQMTVGSRRMIENRANRDDVLPYFQERCLPFADDEANDLAETVWHHPPEIGALGKKAQRSWFDHFIECAGEVEGVLRLYAKN